MILSHNKVGFNQGVRNWLYCSICTGTDTQHKAVRGRRGCPCRVARGSPSRRPSLPGVTDHISKLPLQLSMTAWLSSRQLNESSARDGCPRKIFPHKAPQPLALPVASWRWAGQPQKHGWSLNPWRSLNLGITSLHSPISKYLPHTFPQLKLSTV